MGGEGGVEGRGTPVSGQPAGGTRARGTPRSRTELLAIARDGLWLEAVDRRELERLRDELLLALSLERDRTTRELLPNPLTRDEFEELDELYRRVTARLAGN